MIFQKKYADDIKQYGRSLVTLSNPSSEISEGYRTIRTNLEFLSISYKLQMITITSATAGEGKSTTATNLSIAYAQLGKKVILVDCNMRRPVIHQVFRFKECKGLSDILVGGVSLDDALQETGIPGLTLLTVGTIPPNPTELLASSKTKELFSDLRNRFEVIIIDSPSMMQVPDTRLLAGISDGMLLVIDSEASNRHLVLRAKEELERTGAQLLGIILNKRSTRNTFSYYS
ncbi:Putative tyrosine-protein kinase YveL [Exiguobacterium sp. 8H]|uniref:CpsD/CapB family tyrosine-protein kinase n=1 Tax=unclassified Exiguobacterium TaxID=2644629 RepID=UPI0012F05AF4|nr:MULTISPECIES: CpsD/CapB family tyrosine-protein kinase [unclassified Exiguobacterium]VXB83450.1 Putative tyrosine-protein kinase YveL [Exiguobacterium sp. 8H]VXB93097.1 putative tyrosine-protein kinase YveL [Exiguobacterium sp. 8A]